MLRFYLIDTYYNNNNSSKDVRDSDKIVCLIFDRQNYSTSTLTIDYSNTSQIKVSCNCSKILKKKSIKDMFCFYFKKQEEYECHHIKWFKLSYFTFNNSDNWTLKKINTFKLFHIQSSTPNGNNIECSICLETINYDNENTYYCNVCKNSIHNTCWNKFLIMNQDCCKANCCICRTGTLRSFIL